MIIDPSIAPVMAVIGILVMADPPKYVNGGEGTSDDDGWDTVGDNPTGFRRKSSARTRRKKARRLFKGTPWEVTDDSQGDGNDHL